MTAVVACQGEGRERCACVLLVEVASIKELLLDGLSAARSIIPSDQMVVGQPLCHCFDSLRRCSTSTASPPKWSVHDGGTAGRIQSSVIKLEKEEDDASEPARVFCFALGFPL
jgi:hypothetical protein